MSAGICIMNKYGVALAADSAGTVTIRGKSTVHNSSQKVFDISESVAVVYYGNSMYMGVPVELVFGLFAKHLQSKRFNHLKDYVDEFIHFLTSNAEMLFPKNQDGYTFFEIMQAFDRLDNMYFYETNHNRT